MQLDLGHLEVHNSFEWHGGDKSVASAVHLDVLHAEVCNPVCILSFEIEVKLLLQLNISTQSKPSRANAV